MRTEKYTNANYYIHLTPKQVLDHKFQRIRRLKVQMDGWDGNWGWFLIKRSLERPKKIVWRLFPRRLCITRFGGKSPWLKFIQEPWRASPPNPVCSLKMPLIQTVWNPINPKFVVASSTSLLRFISILPHLYICPFVYSRWTPFVKSFPSSIENLSWIFVFDQRPLWSSLKAQNCIELFSLAL